MTDRTRYPLAVHVFLWRAGSVLLLRRSNTGFEDGKLSVPAGHVEPGESVTEAAVRELREEVGVRIRPEELAIVGAMHRRSAEGRVDFFAACEIGTQSPENCEPEKCSELIWADPENLCDEVIPYVRAALERLGNESWYLEFGWTQVVDDANEAPGFTL